MTRRFKLVTEKEYEMLGKLRHDGEMSKVWDANLPEEVKAMLFQDFTRYMLKKKDLEENKPVPVKITTPTTLPTVTAKQATPTTHAADAAEEMEEEEEQDEDETMFKSPRYYTDMTGVQKKMQGLFQFMHNKGYMKRDGGLDLGGIKVDKEDAHKLMRSLADGRVGIPYLNSPALDYLRKKSVPTNLLAVNKRVLFATPNNWAPFHGVDKWD